MSSTSMRLVGACLALAALSCEAGTGVELDAPAPLDVFLRRHLDLPATPVDVTERAALVRRARREIADLLATEAYFSPHIDLYPQATDGLRIVVAPGVRTTVATVEIGFRGHLAGADAALDERRAACARPGRCPRRGLPLGGLGRRRSRRCSRRRRNRLRCGAPRRQPRRDRSGSAAAHLELTLDSGPATRFGPLTVDGLKRYDRARVAELAPFAPGEPYRRAALLDFQSRLQNTPWFHSVAVEAVPERTSAEDDAHVPVVVPIHVTLAEAPAKRIGLGVGVSTNTGARGEVNFRHHDFLGRAWDFGTGLRLEQKRQSLFASLDLLPDTRGYRLGFGGRIEATDIEGLATTRQVLGATRSRTEGRIETRLGLEWQREERRPDGVMSTIDRALALDWHWIRRATDDLLDPRHGNVVELRIGGASRRLLSDQDFLRLHLRAQQWWPIAGSGRATSSACAAHWGIPWPVPASASRRSSFPRRRRPVGARPCLPEPRRARGRRSGRWPGICRRRRRIHPLVA
ncbi:MAG: outer membrane protein assembly factor [Sulfuritalea sp.]|nr:outer membrane protein assembly factor [Sulfuritalea sp.]